MIPLAILTEVGGRVSEPILVAILEKLGSVLLNKHEKAACQKGAPELFVTRGKTPYLREMQKLELVKREPIHKPGCGCDFSEQPADAYGLVLIGPHTTKAEAWINLWKKSDHR